MKKLLNKRVITAFIALVFAILGTYNLDPGQAIQKLTTDIAVSTLGNESETDTSANPTFDQ